MLKKALKIAAVVLVVLVVALWMRKAHYDAHYFDKYDPKAPLNVTVLETEELNADAPEKAYTLTKLTFDGYGGEKVPTLMAMPKKADGKRMPAVVFLHGIGQNKNFLKELAPPFCQTGFMLLSFDQFMQGERKLPKGTSGLASLQAFRQRPWKTVNETRRLIDYLAERPDVDARRIYLVGELRRHHGEHGAGEGQAPARGRHGLRRRRPRQAGGLRGHAPRRRRRLRLH